MKARISALLASLLASVKAYFKGLFTKKAAPAVETASPEVVNKPTTTGPLVTDPQKTSLDNFLGAQTHVAEVPGATQSVVDHSGFDMGTIPNAEPRSNTMVGGHTYVFKFNAKESGAYRLEFASEQGMGAQVFTVADFVYNGTQIHHVANTGANFLPLSLPDGAGEFSVTLDKTDNVYFIFRKS